MKRFVLDTSVIVAGMRSPKGASARLLELAALDRFDLVLTPTLALEYEAVCLRPEHCAAAGLSAATALEFVLGLLNIADPVQVWYKLRPVAVDPDDDLVIEAAVNGGVDAIVSFNERDMRIGGARFGIGVLRPA